jgi:hypothetical protein
MTQRQIDEAQDELDARAAERDRCPECGQALPKKPAEPFVYAVKLRFGDGYLRWSYSLPVTKVEAEREIHDLKKTGHEAIAMTLDDATAHKEKFGKRRFRK